MPLQYPDERTPMHTRTVSCSGYSRDDGLWDIEAHMTDVKSYTVRNDFRSVAAGAPFHAMSLRVTLDDLLTIHAIEVSIDAAPHQICPRIVPDFQCLVGLRIGPGFNAELRRRLGAERGCAHLVELFAPLATTAIQTVLPLRPAASAVRDTRPGPIGGCHALAEDSPVVARYWPRRQEGAISTRSP